MKHLLIPCRRLCCASLLLALLCAWNTPLQAQCPTIPSQVYPLDAAYEAGRFEVIADMKGCADSLYHVTERHAHPSRDLMNATETFYNLYVMSNLALSRNEEAERATSQYLQRFPRLEVNEEVDPPGLRLLLDTLVPYARTHLGVYAGANFSLAQVAEPSPVFNDITAGGALRQGPTFRNRPRMDLGFEWQRHFGYQHSLLVGLGYEALAMATDYASSHFDARDAKQGDWSLSQYDKYNFVKLPVSYQYRIPLFQKKNHRQSWLGMNVGGFARVLVHSESELLATTYLNPDSADPRPKSTRYTIAPPQIRREYLTGGLQAGIGYQADYGYFSFYLRLTAQVGLSQMRKDNSEYQDDFQEYIWLYQLSDQNFRLHSLKLTAGFLLPSSYSVHRIKSR